MTAIPTWGTLGIALALSVLGPGRLFGQEDHLEILSFDSPGLSGWSGGPPETLSQDSLIVHGGQYAGRIDRGQETGEGFSSFTMSLPVAFAGETLELRGWLRTKHVSGFAGLWLREDGTNGFLEFDNMQDRDLHGTTEWTEYRLMLPLNDKARSLSLGALLVGEGTLWVDDLELLVDGVPISDALPLVRVPSAVELDTEFDRGSGIEARKLTSLQVESLALLGRVWGFAKYHHPRITGGEVNWDYELFRVLPSVLDAEGPASARISMADWLVRLGDPAPCDPCASLPADAQVRANVEWIGDRNLLGEELSDRLIMIYGRRSTQAEQYYVSFVPGIGNPDFSNEAGYRDRPLPDIGFRLLALFRFWNIIEYWFPYRDVIGGDWSDVMVEFVPLMMTSDTVDEYRLIWMELVARVNDTHANLWGNMDVRPPRGSSELPVTFRFVEGKVVVTGFSHPVLGPATGLQVGDVIDAIDGNPIDSLVESWRPYYAASNETTRLRDIARTLTRGETESVLIAGSRADSILELAARRVPIAELDRQAGRTHDLPGETFQLLTDEVAYLKLSSVVSANIREYLARAAEAQVLVVDIRNYPSAFVVYTLGGHLINEVTEFARFTVGDAANPGAFLWTPAVSFQPLEPYFSGTVVVLVDEASQSMAEYTAMALRAVPNSLVVGSTTAGADGNISPIPLPGGANSVISGIGVFYPDKTPTQRVGIVPDVEARPTIAGIRAGRDEVLEAAVSYVLGRKFGLTER